MSAGRENVQTMKKPMSGYDIRMEYVRCLSAKVPQHEMNTWAAYETAAILAEIRQLLDDGHSG
jgi:hypothetical protein